MVALFTAGEPITADALNLRTQKLVQRGQRVTSSSGSSASEVGIMRIDGAQLYAGYLYVATCPNAGLDVSTNGETPRLNLRYTVDGSTATTSSTQMTMAQADVPDAAVADHHGIWGTYVPSSDVVMSLLLSIVRAAGAGTVVATGGSGAPGPLDLMLWNMGPDTGDTATEL